MLGRIVGGRQNWAHHPVRRSGCTYYVPATKYDAKRLRILSAIIETARSSALSHARCWANRCAEPGISKEARPNVEELRTTLPVAISVRVNDTLTADIWVSGRPLATSTMTVWMPLFMPLTCSRYRGAPGAAPLLNSDIKSLRNS